MFQVLSKYKFFLTSCFIIFCLLYGNSAPLYDQDEAAYAGFAKRMWDSGDFLSIDFPFSTPHRKPPLHFWVSALSFGVFGESEFSLRLFPSLWIFCTCLLTAFFAKRFYGKDVSYLSLLILGCSLYFPLNGKIALVDSLLVFCETLGFFSVFIWVIDGKKIAKYLFWTSIAFGCLVKGPPILIYLGGVCFLLLLRKDTRTSVWKLNPFFYLPLALSPLLIWGTWVWQKTDGELIKWMLEWYVFRRATDPVFGQSGPPGTYLLLFFIGLFPFSFYLPSIFKSWFEKVKSNIRSKKEILSFFQNLDKKKYILFAGLIFSWIFYEFLASKLPSYPLAAYPIFGIIIARFIDANKPKLSFKIITSLAFLFSFAIVSFVLPLLSEKRKDTIQLSKLLNNHLTKEEPVYVQKNVSLPSLAFYSGQNFKEVSALTLTNPKGYFLLTEEEVLLWEAMQFPVLRIFGPEKVWAYDRNKTLSLVLVKLN